MHLKYSSLIRNLQLTHISADNFSQSRDLRLRLAYSVVCADTQTIYTHVNRYFSMKDRSLYK